MVHKKVSPQAHSYKLLLVYICHSILLSLEGNIQPKGIATVEDKDGQIERTVSLNNASEQLCELNFDFGGQSGLLIM